MNLKSTPATLLLGLGSGLVIAALLVSLYQFINPDQTVPETQGSVVGEAAVGAIPPGPAPTDPAQPGPLHSDSGQPGSLQPAGGSNPSEPEPEGEPDREAEGEPDREPARDPDQHEPITVSVPRGATATEIGKLLAQAGLMRDEQGFMELVRQREAASQLREGEYRFSLDEPLEDVLERLIKQRTELPAR